MMKIFNVINILLILTLSGCSLVPQQFDEFDFRPSYSCIATGGHGLTFLDNNYYKLANKYPGDLPKPETDFRITNAPAEEHNACVAHFRLFSF